MDNQKIFNKMDIAASNARGNFLNQITKLEKVIDVYLSMYFSQTGKQNTFMRVFLSKTELTRKINIFKESVSSYKNGFKKSCPKYINELEIILKTRNVFAHEVIDLSEAGIVKFNEDILVFDNFRKNRIKTEYTKERLQREVELIGKYITSINKLLQE